MIYSPLAGGMLSGKYLSPLADRLKQIVTKNSVVIYLYAEWQVSLASFAFEE